MQEILSQLRDALRDEDTRLVEAIRSRLREEPDGSPRRDGIRACTALERLREERAVPASGRADDSRAELSAVALAINAHLLAVVDRKG